MNIKITPRGIFGGLLYLIAFLLFANFMAIALRLYFHDDFAVVVRLFDFNAEKNIPTLYSSLALLLSAVLLLGIGATRKRLGAPPLGLVRVGHCFSVFIN